MSEEKVNEVGLLREAGEGKSSALFASLVMNQAQMAYMFMGRVPHPETGEPTKDLYAARLFIDQLEMLEEKTRGNLSEQERRILRDNLTALRLAYVEAADAGAKTAGGGGAEKSAKAEVRDGEVRGGAGGEAGGAAEGESRKKFSKKY